MKRVVAQILAGGEGERLYPLTRDRAKPAVRFGGSFRIIDFALSNCVNSEVGQIQVLVQYRSESLDRHIRVCWGTLGTRFGVRLEVVDPRSEVVDNRYAGTADAVYQNLHWIEKNQATEALVLAGDHVYRMDFSKMLDFHRDAQADLTVSCLEVGIRDAKRFGIMDVAQNSRVVRFEEKPAKPTVSPAGANTYLASMGIYVFNAAVLKEVLVDDAGDESSSHDFGENILPKMVESCRVFAYNFGAKRADRRSYWRDIGTIDSYWQANMELVAVTPTLDLHDPAWPIGIRSAESQAAQFAVADAAERSDAVVDSILSQGCVVRGRMVKNSVLSPAVRVNRHAEVERCVLFDGAEIGAHCKIRNAIVESEVHVPAGTVIGDDAVEDAERHFVTAGGVVVVQGADFGTD